MEKGKRSTKHSKLGSKKVTEMKGYKTTEIVSPVKSRNSEVVTLGNNKRSDMKSITTSKEYR